MEFLRSRWLIVLAVVAVLALVAFGIIYVRSGQKSETLAPTPAIVTTPSVASPRSTPVSGDTKLEIEGKIIAKTADTFTVEANGQKFIIHFLEDYTEIFAPPKPGFLTVKDLSIGDKISGTALVQRTLSNEVKIIGENLMVPKNFK